jgi:hypothetical protein
MKRRIVVSTIGLAVLACGSASAAPGHASSAPYDMPGGVSAFHVGMAGLPAPTASYTLFKVKPGEKSVVISLADTSGRPVAFDVEQDGTALGTFCGSTGKAVRLPNKALVMVTPVLGACDDGVSVPTSGTVSARFGR